MSANQTFLAAIDPKATLTTPKEIKTQKPIAILTPALFMKNFILRLMPPATTANFVLERNQ
jgi:hypothetical protein